MTRVTVEVRRLVASRAGYRCEYCKSQEAVLGMPFEIEHIVPLAAGGNSSEDNLCLACPRCNRHKGAQLVAVDVETSKREPLFHPRHDIWREHFSWSSDGLRLIGLTATGRATVEALQMNNAFVLRSRQLWVLAGWHPLPEG